MANTLGQQVYLLQLRNWASMHVPVCCIDKVATVLSAKASQCNIFLKRLAFLMEGIGQVDFLFDFQWTRRHV